MSASGPRWLRSTKTALPNRVRGFVTAPCSQTFGHKTGTGNEAMFRFLLKLEDGEPHDPAVFVTVVPNWTVGETFLLGDGERFRILAIDADIVDELIEQGFNAVFHGSSRRKQHDASAELFARARRLSNRTVDRELRALELHGQRAEHAPQQCERRGIAVRDDRGYLGDPRLAGVSDQFGG
jgi:hypothetical protein